MPSSFPVTSIDVIPDILNPTQTLTNLGPWTLGTRLNLLQQGLAAVETKVGLDSSTDPTSLDYKVRAVPVSALTSFPGGTTTFLRADGTFAVPAGGGGGGGNPYLTTNSSFVMPAVGATQNVTLGSTADLLPGQTVTITDGTHTGEFYVSSITNGTVAVLGNNNGVGQLAALSTMGAGRLYMGGGDQIDNVLTHFQRGDGTFATPPSVSGSAPGYAPAFPGTTTTYFRGDGSYATLPGNSTSQSGIVATAPNLTTQFYRGDATWAALPAVSSSVSGLIPAYPGNTTTFFRGDGSYAAIPTVTSGAAGLAPASGGGTSNFLRADLTWAGLPANSTSVAGTVAASPNDVTKFYRGDSTFAVPPSFAGGAAGYAPVSAGGTVNYLRADGSWATPPGTGTTGGVLTANSSFVMPAVAGTVSVTVGATAGMVAGQMLLVTDSINSAAMSVSSVTNSTTVVLINSGGPGNEAVGGTMGSGVVYLGSSSQIDGAVTHFWNGTGAWSTPPTVTSGAPGYAPSFPGTTTTFFRGDGTYASLPGNSTSQAGTVATAPNLTSQFYRGDATWAALPAVSSSVAGLVPAFPGTTTTYFRGDGTYAAVPAATATVSGLVPTPPNNVTTFLRGDATFATPPNFGTSAAGYAPASGGGTTNFLRADGSWAAPPGGGGSTNPYTTNASFTVPASGSTVSVTFTSTAGMQADQGLYITGWGVAQVQSVTDSTHAVILNVPYVGNAASGTISSGTAVYVGGAIAVATATAAGMVPAPPNSVTQFLRGDASFATPPTVTSGAAGYAPAFPNTTTTFFRGDGTYATPPSATATVAGYVPTPPNNTTTYLRGDATFAAVPTATATTGGLLPVPPNNVTTFLRGDATFAALPVNSTSAAGTVATSPNDVLKFYRGDSTWAVLPYTTETNGTFVVPAAGSTVAITIVSSSWPVVGQTLLISDGTRTGFFEVTVVTSATALTVANRGYLGNSVSGTMATGAFVRLVAPGLATATQPGMVPVPPNNTTTYLRGDATFAAVPTATATTGGLVPTPPNDVTTFLRGDSTFATPPTVTSSAAGYCPAFPNTTTTYLRGDGTFAAVPAATSTVSGLVPTPPNNTTTFLRGDATFSSLPANSTSIAGTVAASPNDVNKVYRGDSTWALPVGEYETNASFTWPAVGSTVAVTFVSTTGMTVGMTLCVLDSGNKFVIGEVTVVTDSTHATLKNQGYTASTGSGTIAVSALAWVAGPGIASGTAPGLLPALTGSTTTFFRADGSYAALPANTTSQAGTVATAPNVAAQFYRGDATWAVPPTVTSGAAGYAPASGGGTTNFLRADLTWAAPPGGGGTVYLTTNATFVMPAVGSTVSVTFGSTTDMRPGQVVTITDGTNTAAMYVSSITNSTVAVMGNNNGVGQLAATVSMGAGHVYMGAGAQIDNNTAHFFRGDGTFVTPPSATATVAGYVPTPPNSTSQFLRGDATWAAPVMKPFKTWVAGIEGIPPSTLYGVFGVTNNRPYVAFNLAATWTMLFMTTVPTGASLGAGLIIRLKWMSLTATTGNATWQVAIERMNTTQGTDSFDTAAPAVLVGTATSGTVKTLVETAITITTIDSIAAGDGMLLRVQRIGADATDTLAEDACLEFVSVETVN